MKKALCAFLMAALIVCMMPAMAFAADAATYTVTMKAGDGTGEDVVVESVPAGDYEIPSCPASFTAPAGKEFAGWTLTEESTTDPTPGPGPDPTPGPGPDPTPGPGPNPTPGTQDPTPGNQDPTPGNDTEPAARNTQDPTSGDVGATNPTSCQPKDTIYLRSNITLTAQWKDKVYVGGGGYYPAAPANPVTSAKTEATSAVQNYVETSKYDAEEAAEVKAIMDKAAKDIAAAKTAEEVKAIEEAAKAEIDKILTTEEKETIVEVKSTQLKARSKMSTLHGKKAVKVTWNVPDGIEFDGFDVYRSNKKNSGYGKKPYFSTTKNSYTNNKNLVKGKTYYYKVRAYKVVNDEKVYTQWSLKAWRTIS